jgi:hypothetical protein
MKIWVKSYFDISGIENKKVYFPPAKRFPFLENF